MPDYVLLTHPEFIEIFKDFVSQISPKKLCCLPTHRTKMLQIHTNLIFKVEFTVVIHKKKFSPVRQYLNTFYDFNFFFDYFKSKLK